MINKFLLFFIFFIFPGLIFGQNKICPKLFLKYSTSQLVSNVTYEDPLAGDIKLSSNGSYEIEALCGDLARGKTLRWGGAYRKVDAFGKKDDVSYSVDATEYLGKVGAIWAPGKEKSGTYGVNFNYFIGFGQLEFEFKELNTGRISEKHKDPEPFNYTPQGLDLSLELYGDSGYLAGGLRSYLLGQKIKFLKNADGTEHEAFLKNHFNVYIGLGWTF